MPLLGSEQTTIVEEELVTISTIRDALNFLATLFAIVSIGGLVFVVIFLFHGERRTATRVSERTANND